MSGLEQFRRQSCYSCKGQPMTQWHSAPSCSCKRLFALVWEQVAWKYLDFNKNNPKKGGGTNTSISQFSWTLPLSQNDFWTVGKHLAGRCEKNSLVWRECEQENFLSLWKCIQRNWSGAGNRPECWNAELAQVHVRNGKETETFSRIEILSLDAHGDMFMDCVIWKRETSIHHTEQHE